MNKIKSGFSPVSQIPGPAEPLHLGPGIAVDDVALVVLETPGDDDEDVPFAYPDTLLDLALDAAHPGDPVATLHPDVVGPHHQFGNRKYLTVSLLGEPDPDNLPGLILLFTLVGDKFLNGQYNISRAILVLTRISYWISSILSASASVSGMCISSCYQRHRWSSISLCQSSILISISTASGIHLLCWHIVLSS